MHLSFNEGVNMPQRPNLLRFGFVLMALAIALPAHAQTDVAQPIPAISGGIGIDDVTDLQSKEKDYNLKIIFAGKDGVFLSDVDVRIEDVSGRTIASIVTEGPILLVKLKAGRYTLLATLNGKENIQKIAIGKQGLKTIYSRFPTEE
jgi:hypothetical protein